MIILYAYIDKSQHQNLIHQYGHICTDSFKAKILRYKRWQDAQLSFLGRVLLKYGLNRYYHIADYQIGFTLENKPFLINQNIHFNISHAKDLVVCCISDLAIGIDVEYVDDTLDIEKFTAQMTANEWDHLKNSKNKYPDFFTLWTQKEATIKADGRGLSIPLASFEIVENQALVEHKRFYLHEICINKVYRCYIAAPKPITQKEIQLEQINVEKL